MRRVLREMREEGLEEFADRIDVIWKRTLKTARQSKWRARLRTETSTEASTGASTCAPAEASTRASTGASTDAATPIIVSNINQSSIIDDDRDVDAKDSRPTEAEVRSAAEASMEIAGEVVDRWLAEMRRRGWRFTGGEPITRANWRTSLLAFDRALKREKPKRKNETAGAFRTDGYRLRLGKEA